MTVLLNKWLPWSLTIKLLFSWPPTKLLKLKITCFTKFRKEMLINRKLEDLSISKVHIVKKVLLATFQINIEIQGVSFKKN